jgi:hypothetical protein
MGDEIYYKRTHVLCSFFYTVPGIKVNLENIDVLLYYLRIFYLMD